MKINHLAFIAASMHLAEGIPELHESDYFLRLVEVGASST